MAAGLKVWSASQWTSCLRTGSRKVESGRGARTGLPSAGRVKGPISQGSGVCAEIVTAQKSRAARVERRRNFNVFLLLFLVLKKVYEVDGVGRKRWSGF
jgi:hypothetical protein